MDTLGSRIKELMEEHKIRVPELSDKTGVNAQTIYGYVKDKKADPSVYNIYAIANFFSVSVEYLIAGNVSEEEGFTESRKDYLQPCISTIMKIANKLNHTQRLKLVRVSRDIFDIDEDLVIECKGENNDPVLKEK